MRDLEKINKIRADQGLALLDKLPEGPAPAGDGKDKPAGEDNPQNQPPPADPKDPENPVLGELDDARLLEALQKKGIPITSLDELKKKEDPAVTAEQREANKLSYALTKGLFSTKDHENFIRERGNPRDIVFGQYHAEAKAEDPSLTDEEIQSEFEEKYGISADPGTRKFKRGVQEIGLLADKILREKYAKIYSAEDAYSKHETAENASRTRSRTIIEKAPAYKADVEAVFNELKTIKIPVDDKESYDVPIPEAALTAVKDLFLNPEYCADKVVKGYTRDELKEIAYSTLARQNLGTLSLEVAKQYHLKRQSGLKGILPGERMQRKNPDRVLSADQKKILAEHGIKEEDLGQN